MARAAPIQDRVRAKILWGGYQRLTNSLSMRIG